MIKKILVIGDFHGKFSSELYNIAKRKDIDLIISPGDFADAGEIRKLVFKNWNNHSWYGEVGLKKAKALLKKSYISGIKILKKLDSLNKKVYIIWGNADFYKENNQSANKLFAKCYDKEIKRMKNIVCVDKKKAKIENQEMIGYGGYVDVTEFIKNPIDKDEKEQKERLRRYKKDEKNLYELFKKSKPKNFIFLIHYAPYKILDKVKYKESPMNNKNVGWLPYNNIIKKYSPKLVICGHMHEYQARTKLNKSIVINPGAAYEGKAAIIELKNDKISKIEFIKNRI